MGKAALGAGSAEPRWGGNFSQAQEKGGRVKQGALIQGGCNCNHQKSPAEIQEAGGEAALQVESIIRTGRGQGGTAGADSRQSYTALVLLVTLLQ